MTAPDTATELTALDPDTAVNVTHGTPIYDETVAYLAARGITEPRRHAVPAAGPWTPPAR